MDDRNAEFAVATHSQYRTTFNTIVACAVDNLFNPENRVGPEDEHSDDFLRCDEIVFYADVRSMCDYGSFEERLDPRASVQRRMAMNTLVRVPRAAIMTNALDPRLVAKVKQSKPNEQILLRDVNTVGSVLIASLDYLKRSDAQTVICLDQVRRFRSFELIKIGVSLDGDLLLLS